MVEMSFAPISERSEGVIERLAEWCERVLDSRWHLIVDLAVDDAIVLQLPELLGEHLLADPWQLAAQGTEAARLSTQRPQDHRLPLAPDDVDGRLETAFEAARRHDPTLTHQWVRT